MPTGRTTGVLDGLRIIELSAFVAVPLGGLTLAQMGADVIRVEPLGGGLDYRRWPLTESGESLYWAGLNKGKRSIAVGMRSEEGRRLIRQLVTAPGPDNGIVITNVSPTWLDYETLSETRSDLIMVTLSGSPDGSTAVDYTINAATGYPVVTGDPDIMVNHVLPAWDVVAGATVATAVLAAERHRSRTGAGGHVQLSLADIAFSTVGHLGHVGEVVINGDDRQAHGNFVFGSFGKDFETADGRVMVTAVTVRQWKALVAATETGPAIKELEGQLGVDFRNEGMRFEARQAITNTFASWFAKRSVAEVGSALDDHHACWGPFRTFRSLVEDDPRLHPSTNPLWTAVDQPGIGQYPMPGTPLTFSSVPRTPPVAAPSLGAHTSEILSEILGIQAEELVTLREANII